MGWSLPELTAFNDSLAAHNAQKSMAKKRVRVLAKTSLSSLFTSEDDPQVKYQFQMAENEMFVPLSTLTASDQEVLSDYWSGGKDPSVSNASDMNVGSTLWHNVNEGQLYVFAGFVTNQSGESVGIWNICEDKSKPKLVCNSDGEVVGRVILNPNAETPVVPVKRTPRVEPVSYKDMLKMFGAEPPEDE